MNRHSDNASASRLVLELAARFCHTHGRPVDEPAAFELATLARQVLAWNQVADYLKTGLCNVPFFNLERNGTFDAQVEDVGSFSLRCFQQSYLAMMMTPAGPSVDADANLVEKLVAAATDGGDIPAELADIDSGLRESRGYGLQAVLAALSVLQNLSQPQPSAAGMRMSAEGLDAVVTETAVDWYSHIDPSEVRQSLRRLTWTQELLSTGGVAQHLHRNVAARLYSRPVVELSDGSVLVPHGAPGLATGVLCMRILEGTWPEQIPEEETALQRALERRRNLVRPIHSFEAEVAATVCTLDLPYLTSVAASPSKPSPQVGVTVRREIDALVVDPRIEVIWVIEAKDLAFPFEAKRIRSELNKYLRPGGHVDKLDEKCADIAANPNEVARRLGVTQDGDWLVAGMFVTRDPSPVACDDRCHHPVVVLGRVADTIRLARRDPPNGDTPQRVLWRHEQQPSGATEASGR